MAEPDNNNEEFEVIAPTALEALQRAEVDMAITTAHRFPRKLHDVKRKMFEYATLDVATADSCNYSLKRENKKTGEIKIISGPSVRMAEIALACYGNITAGSRVVEMNEDFISCQGVCHDLENNVRISVEITQRILMRNDDGKALAAAAGCSKALRNAVLTVIPRAIVKPVADSAAATAAGDAKTMVSRRKEKLDEFKAWGVSEKEVLAYLGIESAEQIGVNEYRTLAGVITAIRENHTTIEDEFGPRGPQAVKAQVPKTEKEGRPPPVTPEKGAELLRKMKEEVAAAKPAQKPAEPPQARAQTKQDDPEIRKEDLLLEPFPEPPPPPQQQPPSKPEPKKKAAPPVAASKPAIQSPVEAVRERLAGSGITERELVEWLDEIGTLPKGPVPLAEVNPKWLAMVLEDWDGIFAQVQEFVKKVPAA